MKKLLFVLMFIMFCSGVCASEHLELVPISGVYSSEYNIDTGSYFSSNQKKYFMNGKVVYCIEPGKEIYDLNYDIYNVYDFGFSSDILNTISLIGYYGFDYYNHQTDRYFMATQELIWETIGNNEIHFTTGINSTGDEINIDYEKGEIMNLVNSHYMKPSFDGVKVSGMYGESVVLTDTNNVLSNYDVVSSSGGVIEGNNLRIDLTTLGDSEIVLKRKKYDDNRSILFMNGSSQAFMYLRSDDEVYSKISINSFLPSSQIVISKIGDSLIGANDDKTGYDFLYEERGLSGVSFGLFASDDIYEAGSIIFHKDELIEEIVTKNGYGSSSLLPNGHYYIKELSTISGYVLDDKVYDVIIDNNLPEVVFYKIDLVNERKKIYINLHKQGEVMSGVSNGSGVFENVSLEKIKFGLYNAFDIYDYDGNLLVKKNSLIKTLITDSSGNISESLDIPFGTYYIKELETKDGYLIDDNIYEFNVSSDDLNINISIAKEPLINNLIKSDLIIYKIDSETNERLEGAYFKIFDNNDNLVYEGVTDCNGILNINNLGYGKYHFYEITSPDGYIINNKLYEFFVTDNNEVIEIKISNERMPITSNILAIPEGISIMGLRFGFVTLGVSILNEKRRKNI